MPDRPGGVNTGRAIGGSGKTGIVDTRAGAFPYGQTVAAARTPTFHLQGLSGCLARNIWRGSALAELEAEMKSGA